MNCQLREQIIGMLPRLRKFALALTGCPDRGEELVQDTCLKALDRARQWQPGTRLDSWLYRIAQNHWIDTIRKNARYADAPPDLDTIPDGGSERLSAAQRHEDRAVRRAVSDLPPDQRAVVALVCIDGASYREAAEILDIPIGTVMSRLSRARKSLHHTLYGEDVHSEASS